MSPAAKAHGSKHALSIDNMRTLCVCILNLPLDVDHLIQHGKCASKLFLQLNFALQQSFGCNKRLRALVGDVSAQFLTNLLLCFQP